MTTSTTTLAPEKKTASSKLFDAKAFKGRLGALKLFKREPIGTITNLAFLVVAILIALQADGLFTALVTALTLLFVGSTAFHANGSEEDVIPHWADVGFLYVVAGAVVFHAWGEASWILITAMIVVGIFTLFVGSVSAAIPIAITFVLTGIGIGVNIGWSATIVPLGLAGLGIIVRILSEKVSARLNDLMHGLWHVLIAASVYTAWLAVN